MQVRHSNLWGPYYLALRRLGLSATTAFVALGRKAPRICFALLKNGTESNAELRLRLFSTNENLLAHTEWPRVVCGFRKIDRMEHSQHNYDHAFGRDRPDLNQIASTNPAAVHFAFSDGRDDFSLPSINPLRFSALALVKKVSHDHHCEYDDDARTADGNLSDGGRRERQA